MADKQDNNAPEGSGGPPPGSYPPPTPPGYGYPTPSPGGYPPPPTGGYAPPPPGQQYAPPPAPKKRSVGKRIVAALVAIVLVIAVKVGLRAVLNHHEDQPVHNGFDYAVGTCLNLSKAGIAPKPTDVHVEPCSSPTALAKVAKRYQGKKNCPNEHYGTLEGGNNGFCLQDNLTVGSCYNQTLINHMFEPTGCTPGVIGQTFKVALRRDGVDDKALCNDDQQPVNFPEPPLTYCLDVLVRTR
ncbi:MAG: hypothetical protein QOD58_4204 [Mycobacterium sp.]|jgi:hypothetical protein|nr:hypothetical protein [Mycobacterium sp.]